jgi:hypothetical protein
VSSVSTSLLAEVRHALRHAGFPLVGEDEPDGRPGLSVTSCPAVVLVTWTSSDGFTALANRQPGARGDSMKAIVQAAVSGLLLQRGHTVTQPSDSGDLLILADQ